MVHYTLLDVVYQYTQTTRLFEFLSRSATWLEVQYCTGTLMKQKYLNHKRYYESHREKPMELAQKTCVQPVEYLYHGQVQHQVL